MKSLRAFWDFSRFSVHGDTQAVFEIDPPKSVMDQIYEAEDTNEHHQQIASQDFGLNGKLPTKPPLSRNKTRKDSFGTVAGLTEHLSDFLHEHGGGDIHNRLEALEEATKRMEGLLTKIGQDLGNDGDSDSNPTTSRVGTHRTDPEDEGEDH